jgi:hypothetical protein
MKRYASLVMVMLGLFLLPAVSAQAQMLKVTVPFDFSAGSATLPSGDYIVSKPNTSQGVLQIRNDDNGASAFVMTQSTRSNRRDGNGKLVFNRYGNHYFLSQVWAPSTETGHRLNPSKAEREIAKSIGEPERQTLTARK